jgi:hypothetical protein
LEVHSIRIYALCPLNRCLLNKQRLCVFCERLDVVKFGAMSEQTVTEQGATAVNADKESQSSLA